MKLNDYLNETIAELQTLICIYLEIKFKIMLSVLMYDNFRLFYPFVAFVSYVIGKWVRHHQYID